VLPPPEGGLLVAPGLGVDVDDVAVLSEAIDESTEAGSVVEHGAPLLESEIGRDDDGADFVATADDMKEQVRGAAVAGDVPELVEDKKVGSRVATEASLGRGDGFLLHEIRECR